MSEDSKNTGEMMAEVIQKLDQLIELMILAQMQRIRDALPAAREIVGKMASGAKVESPKEAESPEKPEIPLAELETMTTTRKEAGKVEYLLHRATADGEYSEANQRDSETPSVVFENKSQSDWLVSVEEAQGTQKAHNPVVSCWIPGDAIEAIRGPENTGTWNELGKNPQEHRVHVSVKPGKYTIYQELRE